MNRTFDVLMPGCPISGEKCGDWSAIADLIFLRTGFLRNELFKEMRSPEIYLVRHRDVQFNCGADTLVAIVIDHNQHACDACGGSGKYRGPTGFMDRCFKCDGTGTPLIFSDEVKPITARKP